MRDADLQERVSRLRQIISEAVPVEPVGPSLGAGVQLEYQSYAANNPLPTGDIREYARKARNIKRIACTYNWGCELQHQLDRFHATSIRSLTVEQLDFIHARMVALEQCVQDGCDPPEVPHAR